MTRQLGPGRSASFPLPPLGGSQLPMLRALSRPPAYRLLSNSVQRGYPTEGGAGTAPTRPALSRSPGGCLHSMARRRRRGVALSRTVRASAFIWNRVTGSSSMQESRKGPTQYQVTALGMQARGVWLEGFSDSALPPCAPIATIVRQWQGGESTAPLFGLRMQKLVEFRLNPEGNTSEGWGVLWGSLAHDALTFCSSHLCRSLEPHVRGKIR